MIERGQVRWADLGEPRGSAPALHRPVLVVQSDRFNASRLRTVVVVALTTNQRLAAMPGNVALPAAVTGLPHDSVANVTQIVTLDRDELTDPVGTIPAPLQEQVDQGLSLVLLP